MLQDIKLEPVNMKQFLNTLTGLRLKTYRQILQRGITDWMSEVKTESAKELLPGPNVQSPYQSAKIQPPVPGKLTNRTGRLRSMLLEERGNFRWTGYGNKRVVTDPTKSKSFNGTVRQVTDPKSEHTFEAWWSVYIRDGSAGLINYRGKMSVKDLKKALAFRAMHERGLKGHGPRMFLRPAADKRINLLFTYMQRNFNKYKELIK